MARRKFVLIDEHLFEWCNGVYFIKYKRRFAVFVLINAPIRKRCAMMRQKDGIGHEPRGSLVAILKRLNITDAEECGQCFCVWRLDASDRLTKGVYRLANLIRIVERTIL